MICAFRAGQVAGIAVFRDHPHYTLDEQQQVAFVALQHRKWLGIAHLYPEEEFIRGFIEGYRSLLPYSDGLTLFSSLFRSPVIPSSTDA